MCRNKGHFIITHKRAITKTERNEIKGSSIEFNKDDKGISLIFVNTEKGVEIFNTIKSCMNVIPAKLKDCLQPNLQHPAVINPKRMIFEHKYAEKGFEYVMKKFRKDSWEKKLHRVLGRIKRKVK